MSRVILWASVSVDGYFEGLDGGIEWHQVDDELHTHVNSELAAMGAFLHGRRTYELMAEFWPTADTLPDATPPTVAFARIWREMPKVVYSRTLDEVDWNSTLVREVVPEEVEALKAETAGDMVVGGADLAATFLAHDLVDEYRLFVNPVVLREGRPLFRSPGPRVALRLAETRAFGNGVVMLRYERP